MAASAVDRLYHWAEPEIDTSSKDSGHPQGHVHARGRGVDILVMDVTNAVRYWDEWDVLFPTMEKMRAGE